MKKIILALMVAVMPMMAMAETDPRDAEISRLMAEKRTKYAELERCVKSSKGLQIAGISTLGLTAGGVALNVTQATKKKDLDGQIKATNIKIDKKKQEIAEREAKEAQEHAEKAAQEKAKPIANNKKINNTKTANV